MKAEGLSASGSGAQDKSRTPYFREKLRLRSILNCCRLWICATCVGLSPPAWAGKPCIAVLYPQVSEPYRVVLEEIMTGIEAGARDWSVRRLPIPEKDDSDKSRVVPADCRAVIGLGRAGVQAATPFVSRLAVAAGAVLIRPGESTTIPTISFVPSTAALFVRLRHFFPGVKTVTVVFDPARSRGLIDAAAGSAAGMGLKLRALEARNLSDAAVLYGRVLDESNPKTDAIWLLRDPSVMDSGAVLALVLKRAWERKLFVFSNQLTHAKHGVLFSVYPDNKKLGLHLAELVRECAKHDCSKRGVMMLQDLGTAVNVRTANRLGIDIDRRHDPYVDLVLPAN